MLKKISEIRKGLDCNKLRGQDVALKCEIKC